MSFVPCLSAQSDAILRIPDISVFDIQYALYLKTTKGHGLSIYGSTGKSLYFGSLQTDFFDRNKGRWCGAVRCGAACVAGGARRLS